jgi:tetratricopeptide (TPR) repeat protein
MKRNILLTLILLCSVNIFSQTAEEWLAKCQKNINETKYLSAVRDCETSIKLKPLNNPNAFYAKSLAHAQRHEHWQAIADMTKALQSFPNDEKGLGQRGEMYLEIWDLDSALADFKKILQINPNNTAALFRRAEVYKRQRKKELAIADLKKLQTLLPNEQQVRMALQQLQYVPSPFSYDAKGLLWDLRTDMSADKDFIAHKTEAEKLKKTLATEKDFEDVLRFLFNSLSNQSGLQKFYKPFAESRTRTFDYVQVLTRCLEKYPENYLCNVLNYDQYSALAAKYENYRDSILEKWTADNIIPITTILLEKSDKQFLETLYSNRGTTYHYKKNYSMALADLEKAVQLSTPESLASAIKNRMLAHRELKNYDLAMADLNKALELKKQGKSSAWIIRELTKIELFNQMNKPALATTEADKILRNLPNDTKEWEVQLQKAIGFLLQGKNDLALSEINKAVATYPNAMNVKKERALIYRALGKIDLAYADEVEYENKWEKIPTK